MKALAPIWRHSYSMSIPDDMMTGSLANCGCSRICLSSSMPSASAICTSISTASGFSDRAVDSTISPCEASTTENPSSSSNVFNKLFMVRSSSTIMTFLDTAGSPLAGGGASFAADGRHAARGGPTRTVGAPAFEGHVQHLLDAVHQHEF